MRTAAPLATTSSLSHVYLMFKHDLALTFARDLATVTRNTMAMVGQPDATFVLATSTTFP